MKLKYLFDSIKKKQDGKVLISNFFYLSLLQIAGYLFPILTLPYLARVIGVEGFGKIAFASAIIVWIQTIADWGFNYTATRDVAQNRDDKEKVSDIFSRVFWSRCVLAIISFIILILFVISIPKFKENSTIILVTFLMIPGHIMFPDWFFQAIEKMGYITIFNILSKILFTILIFVFVKDKEDYIFQPLFISLGYIISGVIAMYLILFKWKYRLLKPSVSGIFSTIKKSADVFLNNLMPNLYNSFSSILLGFFHGEMANGRLDAGNKFAQVGQQFIQIVSRVFYPFLSRRIDKHSAYVKLSVGVSFLMAVILFFASPLLIKYFFTEDFYDSILVLRMLSISIIFLSISNVYGTNYLIIQGYEKPLRNITAISSIIGFVISFPLIYYYSYIGAALTICITRGILGFSVMYKAVKIKNTIMR